MQVVLNNKVEKLGYRGDVVNVKRGYFRNYLFPNGLADYASKVRLKVAESRKGKLVMEKEQIMGNAKDVLSKLKGLSVTISAKVSDSGKLYGSITEEQVIAAVLEACSVKLEKEFLKMDHLKEVGEYDVVVHLGDGLEETLKVSVVPQ